MTALEVLADAHRRLRLALDAIAQGDRGFAEHVLDDLAADLWAAIERLEREARG